MPNPNEYWGRGSVSKEVTTIEGELPKEMPMMNAMKPADKAQVSVPALLLFLVLVTLYPVKAQSQTDPIAPTPVQAVQQSSDQSAILVKTKLVSASLPVRDSTGEAVPNLTKVDFHVEDNGANQIIESLDTRNALLSVAIVVETSSRVEALLPAVRRAGVLFSQTVLGPNGEAALIGYNDEVDRLMDFTSNDEEIEKAVKNIQMGTSGTHLYDALSQAVDLLRARSSSRRRVIVVLAESTDTGSDEKIAQVIHDAQLAKITIYSVALSSTAAELRGPEGQWASPSSTPPGIFALPPLPGFPQTPTTEVLRAGNINRGALLVWVVKHASAPLRDNSLEIAATSTDGLYQSTFGDSSIEAAIDKIGGELHTQ
jgi:hypothetical protein